jgi:hypothetical protein
MGRMNMDKKGQVSVFAIIGVVMVVIIMLLYFLNDQGVVTVFGKQDFLSGKLDSIRDEVDRCAVLGVEQGMDLLGKQGGDFTPNQFVKYENMNVRYYALNLEGESYLKQNNMPLLGYVQTSFEEYMIDHMKGCVNPSVLESGLGYEIEKGEMDIDVLFNDDVVEVEVDYDLSVKKEQVSMRLPVVESVVPNVAFEDLYSVAYDVVDAWARGESFDQLGYMLQHKGRYIIDVDKPYPDTIYMISKDGNPFELWFAVQGQEDYIA